MTAAASDAPLHDLVPAPAPRPPQPPQPPRARALRPVPATSEPPPSPPATLGRGHQLPRSGPRLAWDPLSVDADAGAAGPLAEEPLEILELTLPQAAPTHDATLIAGAVARAVAEVLAGTRPAPQVQRWLHEDVWQVVRRRAALSRRSPASRPRPSGMRVIKVHPCQISPTALEASVILHDGERVRAAAIRLQLRRGQWRAAALRIG